MTSTNIKIRLPRTRNFLEKSGSGTQYIVEGISWARGLASDYQYHGREQETPWITRTRLLYSAKAIQRRDERPQDAWSHHRCCGRSGGRHVKRYSYHAFASDIRRGINERSRRLDWEDHCEDLDERGPDCFGVCTGCLSRPSKNLQTYCVPSSRSTAPSQPPFHRTPLDEMLSCTHEQCCTERESVSYRQLRTPRSPIA